MILWENMIECANQWKTDRLLIIMKPRDIYKSTFSEKGDQLQKRDIIFFV